ncbi:hypothetical protein ACTFIU_003190 [Dictyostelium citrinum]
MKFIATLIIFVFSVLALTNGATVYSGFSVSSSDSKNPCSKSIPQSDVGVTCIDVCGLGNIKIDPVSGEINKYTINGYAPSDKCTTSMGTQTLTCGTPVSIGTFSIDCAPVSTTTTTGTSSTVVISFTLIIASLLAVLAL